MGTNYNDEITLPVRSNECEIVAKIKINMPTNLSDTQIKGLYDYQQIEKPVSRKF